MNLQRRDFLKLGFFSSLCGVVVPNLDDVIEPTGGDDTAMLQSAIDALNANYAFVGVDNARLRLKGTFRVSSLTILDKYRVRIEGEDALIVGDINITGCTYLMIDNIHVNGNITFSRHNGVGTALSMRDCMIHGDLNIDDADTSTFERVTVYGKTTLRKWYATMKGVSFYDCWLDDVDLYGVDSVSFKNCYHTGQIVTSGINNGVHFHGVVVENVPIFLHVVSGKLHNLTMEGVNATSGQEFLIEHDSPDNSYYWELHVANKGSTKYLHVKRGGLYAADIKCGGYDIINDGVITESFIVGLGSLPISGNPATFSKVMSTHWG